MLWMQAKTFLVQKVKVQLMMVKQTGGSGNFSQVARTLTIRQGQVDLKTWILRPGSKLYLQIQQLALREYQVSLASHSPDWFVTFTTLRAYRE